MQGALGQGRILPEVDKGREAVALLAERLTGCQSAIAPSKRNATAAPLSELELWEVSCDLSDASRGAFRPRRCRS